MLLDRRREAGRDGPAPIGCRAPAVAGRFAARLGVVAFVLVACGGGGDGCPKAGPDRVSGNERDRARMAEAVEAGALDAVAVALYDGLSEERRRQLGVPIPPPALINQDTGNMILGGLDLLKPDDPNYRGEFRVWLDHPERLPGAAPGVTGNPLRAMAEEALRDGRFDDALERVGLRCGQE